MSQVISQVAEDVVTQAFHRRRCDDQDGNASPGPLCKELPQMNGMWAVCCFLSIPQSPSSSCSTRSSMGEAACSTEGLWTVSSLSALMISVQSMHLKTLWDTIGHSGLRHAFRVRDAMKFTRALLRGRPAHVTVWKGTQHAIQHAILAFHTEPRQKKKMRLHSKCHTNPGSWPRSSAF